jgi:hypothetical protein
MKNKFIKNLSFSLKIYSSTTLGHVSLERTTTKWLQVLRASLISLSCFSHAASADVQMHRRIQAQTQLNCAAGRPWKGWGARVATKRAFSNSCRCVNHFTYAHRMKHHDNRFLSNGKFHESCARGYTLSAFLVWSFADS